MLLLGVRALRRGPRGRDQGNRDGSGGVKGERQKPDRKFSHSLLPGPVTTSPVTIRSGDDQGVLSGCAVHSNAATSLNHTTPGQIFPEQSYLLRFI